MKVMVLTIHFCCRPFHLSTQRERKRYVSSSTQSSIQDHCAEAGPRSSQEAKSAGQHWGQHRRGVRLGADIAAVRLSSAPQGGGRLSLAPYSQQLSAAKELTLDTAILLLQGWTALRALTCNALNPFSGPQESDLWQSAI